MSRVTLRVLIVDDYEDIADLVATALRYAGDTAHTWTSGFERLLAAAPWEKIDVAIIDLALRENGDFDGTDILRYLRESHPGIRRVLYSGTNLDWMSKGAQLRSLADAVVIKDVNISEIVEAVHG